MIILRLAIGKEMINTYLRACSISISRTRKSSADWYTYTDTGFLTISGPSRGGGIKNSDGVVFELSGRVRPESPI